MIIMKDIYPDFYKRFKCIANRCEDSCCKDWDIDVDSETEKFYNTVKTPLGDKIRSLTYTDEYGERVFKSSDGRCPFWNDDMLCDIYIGLGEEHLSRTCANFPRVKVSFGDFRENAIVERLPTTLREASAIVDDAIHNRVFRPVPKRKKAIGDD